MPYVANDLPGLHLLACGDADGLAVGVEGLQAAAVVELDVVAIAAAPTVHAVGDYDGTIGGGQDGRACGGSNVGAAVVADLAGDGIGAVAERRGNAARNRQRPLQRAGALPGTGRGQNLPTAGQKPTQQFGPQGFVFWRAEQVEIFLLAGGVGIVLRHLVRRFVCQFNQQHRLCDGFGGSGFGSVAAFCILAGIFGGIPAVRVFIAGWFVRFDLHCLGIGGVF